MFPYPSGKLHMGHVRVYTISDAMARYHRLTGKQVIHPMGWDAFGLPAENAAIENNEKPDEWTYKNIAAMKKQLEDLCYSFDWDREFATCDPTYYKWTQFIFLKMFEAGLVYQKKAMVNWDPVDKTVLAEEQIDDDGRSWRSGALVEKKYLRQWYIKTTAFAKSLYDGLSEVDASLWKDIIKLQKHWIGECTGTNIEFIVKHNEDDSLIEDGLTVHTDVPQLLHGVSHISLAQTHQLNNLKYHCNNNTHAEQDILLNVHAVHPLTNEKIPIIISKTAMSEHIESKLAVPSIDESDRLVAEKFDFTFKSVLDSNNEEQILDNCGELSGMKMADAFQHAIKLAKENKYGGDLVSARLHDWLISRQRYWGTPIPIVHCDSCEEVPVPFADLPVALPPLKEFSEKGRSALAADENWSNTKCPKCGGAARRETDTMDTFVDSSWYFLRYLDPTNDELPFSRDNVDAAMPVDLYIGGKEHATLHLYFARFFNHFLQSVGMLTDREPFHNLLTQGMVMGQSYRVKSTGQYIKPEQVDFTGEIPVEKGTGAELDVSWEKMSKSKYNGVDPLDIIDEHGSDSTRLCILAGVAPKSDRHWSADFFRGVLNWQQKIWSVASDFIDHRHPGAQPVDLTEEEFAVEENKIFDARNYFLKEVTFHMEKTFLISTAISRLQGLTNTLKKAPFDIVRCSEEYERALCDLVIMLAPFSPCFASELWSGISSVPVKFNDYKWHLGVLDQSWPDVDMKYGLPLIVKSNKTHKELFTVKVPREQLDVLSLEEAAALVQDRNEIKQLGEIHKQYLNIEPGYRASLTLITKRQKKSKKASSTS
ncbi:putative leucine--tRNA ligase, mitochondrial isoform X2 [Tubulanus polymorphus]